MPSVSATAIGWPTARYWQVAFLFGEHHVQARAVVAGAVGPAGQVDDLVALDAARARIDRVGADAPSGRRGRRRVMSPLCVHGKPHALTRCSRAWMSVRNDSSRSATNLTGRRSITDERGGRHLVGIDVHLDAEGAADVLRDHAHVALGHAEVPREDVLHHVRRLRRVIHGERVLGGVVVGEDRARPRGRRRCGGRSGRCPRRPRRPLRTRRRPRRCRARA